MKPERKPPQLERGHSHYGGRLTSVGLEGRVNRLKVGAEVCRRLWRVLSYSERIQVLEYYERQSAMRENCA